MRSRSSAPRAHLYRAYQQRRARQRRIAVLVIGFLLLLALIAGAIWGAWQALPHLIQIKTPNRDTAAFQQWLDRDWGQGTVPSLLYYQNMDYALLRQQPASVLQNKLLPIRITGEDTVLKQQLQQVFATLPADRFNVHFFFYNPQDGKYVNINGYSPVSAASVIKLPVLMDYLMSLDENLIAVDTPLLYAEFHRAGGAGELQYRPAGEAFLANDVAAQMIRISDNTSTNMMISYLGGTDAVNQRLQDLGLLHTRIRNWLPDLPGTNTITPYEMVSILYNIEQGALLSQLSRYDGLEILKSTHNRRLLVWQLPKEAVVAHKTGDIGTSIGDSGIVYLPDGRKYYVSVQVERPYNDYSPRDTIQLASRLMYDYVSAQSNPEPFPALRPMAVDSSSDTTNGSASF